MANKDGVEACYSYSTYQSSDDLLNTGETAMRRAEDLAAISSAENNLPTSTFNYKHIHIIIMHSTVLFANIIYLMKFGVDTDTFLNKGVHSYPLS